MSKGMMGGGTIFVAAVMALTQYLGLPGYLHYVWAASFVGGRLKMSSDFVQGMELVWTVS